MCAYEAPNPLPENRMGKGSAAVQLKKIKENCSRNWLMNTTV